MDNRRDLLNRRWSCPNLRALKNKVDDLSKSLKDTCYRGNVLVDSLRVGKAGLPPLVRKSQPLHKSGGKPAFLTERCHRARFSTNQILALATLLCIYSAAKYRFESLNLNFQPESVWRVNSDDE